MAKEKYDLYERLASVILDAPLEEVTKEQRNTTKELVWSWAYSVRTPDKVLGQRYEKVKTELEKMQSQEI